MTKQNDVILDVLDVLYDIRAEVHGDVGDSVINRIDDAINDLETKLYEDIDNFNALDVLTMLGKVIEVIPAIQALFKLLQ